MLAVLILDPTVPLPAGRCDADNCEAVARYAVGNVYLCVGCLIDNVEAERIKMGATIYRVLEVQI